MASWVLNFIIKQTDCFFGVADRVTLKYKTSRGSPAHNSFLLPQGEFQSISGPGLSGSALLLCGLGLTPAGPSLLGCLFPFSTR